MSTGATPIQFRHYAGIFLLSLATLLLELALTRVLSVALWYHFGFLIISTALLGFGAAGVVLALWTRLREHAALDASLACLALGFGLSAVGCFWLMQRIPFDPFSLLADRRQLALMPLYYLVISLPFFFSGLALALLFARGSGRINRLYAYDLVGAGVGCAALALVMPAVGGSGSIVVAAAIGLLSAVAFAAAGPRRLQLASAGLVVIASVLVPYAERLLPISVTANKVGPPTPPIYTAWNSLSRIDIHEVPGDPRTGDPASRRIVYDAGTAGSGMDDLRPGVREYVALYPDRTDAIARAALVGKERPKVLIIGSAGGREVLEAVRVGASEITAVEINPIVNDVVSRRMDDFWGGLFNLPEVKLVTEEGRSFVRRSRETYDVIISSHTISNAAVASGALSLAENYVLTREAFQDYLDRLAPDGVLYFTRPEAQVARLLATGREALASRGITEASHHFYAYRFPPSGPQVRFGGERRMSFIAGFLLKKSPLTPEEIAAIEAALGFGQPPRSASEPAPERLYSPFDDTDSLYRTLATTRDLEAVYASQAAQIAPATDDRPFFNQHTRWSSLGLGTFREIFTQERLGRLALEDRPVAEITLIMVLAQTTVIAGAFILLPLVRFSREGLRAPRCGRFLLYFAGLGLGFIMVEIALLGRFGLFLGQPVYTFAVVLAGLLVFTGAGSAWAGRLREPERALRVIIPAILLVLLAIIFVSPMIFSLALGWPLGWRIALAVALIAPLGLVLGMPLPLGIRIVARVSIALVPWSWGVNGFFTVIGTTLALVLGMAFGFSSVLAVGGFCYVAAGAVMVLRGARVAATPELGAGIARCSAALGADDPASPGHRSPT